MAPVFSRAAWKCVWHLIQVQNLFSSLIIFFFGYFDDKMVDKAYFLLSLCVSSETVVIQFLSLQNDLIHGWGLDMKLGYCAQVLKIFSIT
jgi:hypothetical protein